MAANVRGLYEVLITEAVQGELERLEGLHVRRGPLRAAEAGDRLALHLGRLIVRAVESLEEGRRVEVGTALARRVVEVLGGEAPAAVVGEAPVEAGEVLRALAHPLPDGSSERIGEPLIPLLDTALLTNAPGEPRVGSQILAEIESADRIDLVMAFIRLSGIRPLLRALERHCAAGRALRVLTTTYTGSTEGRALEALQSLGAQVRVSYDTSVTRLHAKSWLFHRHSGFSTAYIGSSNLTHSAQVTGLEWNVRVSGPRNPAVIEKVSAVFKSYWSSGDFIDFRSEDFEKASEARGPVIYLSPVELRPEPFQERLLEQIALSRRRGHHRNLLVAATGTGKTVMAAVDYARLRGELKRARLLFVAHREEILTQSLATFRHALRDPSFGELWVGGEAPDGLRTRLCLGPEPQRLGACAPRSGPL